MLSAEPEGSDAGAAVGAGATEGAVLERESDDDRDACDDRIGDGEGDIEAGEGGAEEEDTRRAGRDGGEVAASRCGTVGGDAAAVRGCSVGWSFDAAGCCVVDATCARPWGDSPDDGFGAKCALVSRVERSVVGAAT